MGKNIVNNDIFFDLDTIILNSPGYIFWKDVNLIYRGCNSNYANLFGQSSPDNIIGKTDDDLNPKSANAFVKQEQRVIRTKKPHIAEYSIVDVRTKNDIILRIEIKPLNNKHGQIIGILAVAVDITSLKLEEQKKLASISQEQKTTYKILENAVFEITGQNFQHRLPLQEYVDELCNCFKNIISQMPGYVYWKNKDFQYIFCNDICVKSLKLKSVNEIVGKTDYDLGWDPKIADEYRKVDEEVIRTGNPKLGFEEILIKDNKTHYLLGNKMPLHNKNGDIIGIIGIAVDMTEQKEAEQIKIEYEKQIAEIHVQEEFKVIIDEFNHILQKHKFNILNQNIGIENKVDKSDKEKIVLNKRQKEILYCLSLNKPPKEIASIIGALEKKRIAPATIQAIITKELYVKFGVYGISNLIEKASILKLIPFSLES